MYVQIGVRNVELQFWVNDPNGAARIRTRIPSTTIYFDNLDMGFSPLGNAYLPIRFQIRESGTHTVEVHSADKVWKKDWFDAALFGTGSETVTAGRSDDDNLVVGIPEQSTSDAKVYRLDYIHGPDMPQPYQERDEDCGKGVVRLYNEVLCRAPDTGGYVHWRNQCWGGKSLDWIENQFRASAEYAGCSQCQAGTCKIL